MQVSVADLDDLTDGVSALADCYSAAQEEVENEMAALQAVCVQCEAEVQSAESELNAANQVVDQLNQLLESLQAELQCAQQAVTQATAELAAAEAELAAAQASGYYDEDGDYVEPDTSAEEAAVEAASAQLTAAEELVTQLEGQVEQAQGQLDNALQVQELCQQRCELAHAMLEAAESQREAYGAAQQSHLDSMERTLNEVSSRVSAARSSLERYLEGNPSASRFDKWVHHDYALGKVIRPGDLAHRLDASQSHMNECARYLYQRDEAFRNRIDTYREKLSNAKSAEERQAVYTQACRGGSGDLAEKFVGLAFKDLGKVDTQNRTYVNGENYTKTDLVITDLKAAVILGRGEGMAAPQGGSLAMEVKTGQSGYLLNQKDHMEFQAQGHQDASASLTLMSRDVHDLSTLKEQEVRDALRDSSSPVFAALPKKEIFDNAVRAMIDQT